MESAQPLLHVQESHMALVKVVTFGFATLVATSFAVAQAAGAQESKPSTAQERPDARYPNPSGQDSKPSTTRVEPTKPAPSSKTPQDSTRGEADDNTYVTGKKRDAAGGCSTPTDAQSANVATDKTRPGDSKSRKSSETVCTTSGASGQSAKEPRVATKDEKPKANPSQTPPTSPRR
jgi:hypothetical protein